MRRALKVGLVAVVTLVAFESLAVTTILPEIEADLGGIAWYGWVTSAFFLGTMIGIVFAGDQADRRGAGAPYVIGLTLFAVGLAIGYVVKYRLDKRFVFAPAQAKSRVGVGAG